MGKSYRRSSDRDDNNYEYEKLQRNHVRREKKKTKRSIDNIERDEEDFNDKKRK